MTHDRSYYSKIQGWNGTTSAKEAEIRLIQSELDRDFENTLDCETVTVNGTSTKLLITKTPDDMIKRVSSRPGSAIYLGDIVGWLGSNWIIDTLDADNRINNKGKMRRCNVTLKWINEKGVIVSKPAFCEDVAKSAEGVSGGSQIQTGEFQIKIKVRKDSDTVKLKRDKRFLFTPPSYAVDIVRSGGHPPAFKLTRVNSVTGDFGGKGYVELTLCEDAFSDATDNVPLMLADYYLKSDVYAITISNATSPLSLSEGADYTLAATVTKGGVADETAIWWYSSDESVATVDQTGKITAVSEGSCVITAQIAATKQQIAVNVQEVAEGAEIRIYLPQGNAVVYGQTLRVEFKAFVDGVETETEFACSVNNASYASVESTGDGYAIVRAVNNDDNIGEEFIFTASSDALDVSATTTLKVRGWTA